MNVREYVGFGAGIRGVVTDHQDVEHAARRKIRRKIRGKIPVVTGYGDGPDLAVSPQFRQLVLQPGGKLRGFRTPR
jgi:hypothetical protein